MAPRNTDRDREGATEQSSVLFSLKELMGIEERRIEEEHQLAQEASLRAEQARKEAEARERAAHEAAQKAERDRQERARQQDVELKTRAEALQAALVEKARLEAMEVARTNELRAAHDHERQLVLLNQDQTKRCLKWSIGGLVALAVVVTGGSLGLYFGKFAPEAEQERREAAERVRQKEEEGRRLSDHNRKSQEEIDQLIHDRDAIRDRPLVTATPTQEIKSIPTVIGPLPTATAHVFDPCAKAKATHDPLDPCAH